MSEFKKLDNRVVMEVEELFRKQIAVRKSRENCLLFDRVLGFGSW
ncbi:hypothetical protein QA612_19915 [Evansella sp. AB-P1]|nr:hypothetical protein [Evansella sp. AB-P1]MDG5789728.1 hypothetical protein [Evansella sp. AB-P1]